MGTGFIVSFVVTAVIIVALLIILIPYDRKYIIRENGKVNFKKTTIYLRWNVFDTITLLIALYTIICVQILNFLITGGKTIDNIFVQYFTNQSQAWVIVTVCYLIMRLSFTLKCVKAQLGDDYDVKQ